MTNRRKRMSHDEWIVIIEAQKTSGLPLDEYCKQHDLGKASFLYHRSRVRKTDESRDSKAGFTEIQTYGSGLRLKGPGGAWTLELDPGFDPQVLRRFLGALEP